MTVVYCSKGVTVVYCSKDVTVVYCSKGVTVVYGGKDYCSILYLVLSISGLVFNTTDIEY